MAEKRKIKFICRNCLSRYKKYYAQCPSCTKIGTFREDNSEDMDGALFQIDSKPPRVLSDMVEEVDDYVRVSTGMKAVDKVFGTNESNGNQGMVIPSIMLLSGEKGVGKSTLLTLLLNNIAKTGKKVIYVSCEEPTTSVALRAKNLGCNSENIVIVSESRLKKIIEYSGEYDSDIIVIDSLMGIILEGADFNPGSTQCQQAVVSYLNGYKNKTNKVIIGIQHQKTSGELRGGEVIQHIVDAMFQLKKDPYTGKIVFSAYRKNRYGNTEEKAYFLRGRAGKLIETTASEEDNVFIKELKRESVGLCYSLYLSKGEVFPTEITSNIALEKTGKGVIDVQGIKKDRANYLLNLLKGVLKLDFSRKRVIVHVSNGAGKLDYWSVDLAICVSIMSSFFNQPLPYSVFCIGELSSVGDLRMVIRCSEYLKSLKKFPINIFLFPKGNEREVKDAHLDVKIEMGVNTILDCIKILYRKNLKMYYLESMQKYKIKKGGKNAN